MMEWPRIIWYVLTLRCEEAERCRCAPDDGDLRRYQVVAERLHRLACRSCRRAKRRLDIVERAMTLLGNGAELDLGAGLGTDARERMLRTLSDEADE